MTEQLNLPFVRSIATALSDVTAPVKSGPVITMIYGYSSFPRSAKLLEGSLVTSWLQPMLLPGFKVAQHGKKILAFSSCPLRCYWFFNLRFGVSANCDIDSNLNLVIHVTQRYVCVLTASRLSSHNFYVKHVLLTVVGHISSQNEGLFW